MFLSARLGIIIFLVHVILIFYNDETRDRQLR